MEASSYDKIYCYAGSEVLINKFGEHDPKILSQYERMFTGARIIDLLKKPLHGTFDLKHLKKIHFYIFQDIYPWAGQLRRVNISKEILFCDAQYVENMINKVFFKLKEEDFLRQCTAEDLPSRAAYYLGEINAVHPFREGNGRAQREFIRELLLSIGYRVDYSRCDPGMMLQASINAFAEDYSLMTELFTKCIINKPLN